MKPTCFAAFLLLLAGSAFAADEGVVNRPDPAAPAVAAEFPHVSRFQVRTFVGGCNPDAEMDCGIDQGGFTEQGSSGCATDHSCSLSHHACEFRIYVNCILTAGGGSCIAC
jgi:hypothetical protein